jgi:hypothetical protein
MAARPLDNQPLQRTGRASRSLWFESASGARPAAERRSVIPVSWRPLTILAVCASVLLVAYLAAAGCGRGTRGYFSPDTLEYRAQSEWLLPMTSVPLYRGPSSTHRYATVDYLISKGFWSPSGRSDPRWLLTLQWNQQWKDGHSELHGNLGMRGDGWIKWSEQNPEMAKALWPKVLDALRQSGVSQIDEATNLMRAVQVAQSVEEFEKMAAEFAAERPRG